MIKHTYSHSITNPKDLNILCDILKLPEQLKPLTKGQRKKNV